MDACAKISPIGFVGFMLQTENPSTIQQDYCVIHQRVQFPPQYCLAEKTPSLQPNYKSTKNNAKQYILIIISKKMHQIKNMFQRTKNQNGKYKKPYYSIVSKKAGKVIDVAQDGPHKGTLIIWDGYNGDNQAFTIVQQGSDYLIKCRQNKGYLTVENANDGARIFLSPQPNAQSRFRLDQTKSGSKEYIIYTFCGKVLDVFHGQKANGSQVIQFTYNGKQNQLWYLNDPKEITSSSSERS